MEKGVNWNINFPKIKVDTICESWKNGGWKNVDIKSKINWLPGLVDQKNVYWNFPWMDTYTILYHLENPWVKVVFSQESPFNPLCHNFITRIFSFGEIN